MNNLNLDMKLLDCASIWSFDPGGTTGIVHWIPGNSFQCWEVPIEDLKKFVTTIAIGLTDEIILAERVSNSTLKYYPAIGILEVLNPIWIFPAQWKLPNIKVQDIKPLSQHVRDAMGMMFWWLHYNGN